MNDEVKKGFYHCKDCGKLIPESAAKTAEGKDYTYYFCGMICYNKWKDKEKRE